MNVEERFEIAAEQLQRVSELAQTLDRLLPIYAGCLQHLDQGTECACATCPFTEPVEGQGSPTESMLKQWRQMTEDMAQLRILLHRAKHSVPIIGIADCTR